MLAAYLAVSGLYSVDYMMNAFVIRERDLYEYVVIIGWFLLDGIRMKFVLRAYFEYFVVFKGTLTY